jgi:PAS domain S-box-containing protein
MSAAVIGAAPARPDERLVELQQRVDLLGAALDVAGTIAWRWVLATDLLEVERQSPGAAWFARTMRESLAKVVPEDRDRVEQEIRAALADDETHRLEFRVNSASGTLRWYATSMRRYLDMNGQPAGLLGATRDATLRKQYELTLARNEEWLRSILETVPECVAVLDAGRRLQLVNTAGLAMLECEGVASILGCDLAGFVVPGHREAFESLHARVMNGAEGSLEFEIEGLGGTRRWMEGNAAPLHDSDGVVGSMLAVLRDVTARRESGARLRVQARILDTMSEGVGVMDAQGMLRFANPAFEDMLGRPRGSLFGEAGRALLARPELDLERAVATMQDARERPTSIELRLRHADGSVRLVNVATTTVVLDDVEHWIGVVQDITERKRLERGLIEAAEREQERIGHDLHDGLGQELTGIALMLKGMQHQLERELPSSVKDLGEVLDLVNEAIQGTRAIAHGLSPVAIQRGGLAQALRGLAQRTDDPDGMRVRFRCAEWPERLELSLATHLYRIAQEALANALRHGRPQEIRISLSQTDDQVRLRIVDDGRGLSPKAARTEGLGLRIMRYRANMIGAVLRVQPRKGGGTEVTVTCPRAGLTRDTFG